MKKNSRISQVPYFQRKGHHNLDTTGQFNNRVKKTNKQKHKPGKEKTKLKLNYSTHLQKRPQQFINIQYKNP